MVKLMSFRVKGEIIKKAWQKKGFMYEGKKVFLDRDYAPEVLKKRKEYTEAKRVPGETACFLRGRDADLQHG